MNADKILSQYEEDVAATGRLLRQFLLTHLKGITEQIEQLDSRRTGGA